MEIATVPFRLERQVRISRKLGSMIGQVKWDMISESLENQVEVFKDVKYWTKHFTSITVLTPR